MLDGFTKDEEHDAQKYAMIAYKLRQKAQYGQVSPQQASILERMAKAFDEISAQEASHKTREELMITGLQSLAK